MRKVRYLFLAAFVAACCAGAMSGCGKEEGMGSDSAGKKNVSVLLNVDSRSVDATDGTPTDEESALHTLRVYAFVGDRRVGYYYGSGDFGSPAVFLMDMALTSTTSQTVEFYVVANEAAMVTRGGSDVLTETTTRRQLGQFNFTELDISQGLPMYCQTTVAIDVAADSPNPPADPDHGGHTQLAQTVDIRLRRPVAKLGVFAAKRPGETAELRITGLQMLAEGTRMRNYLMEQNRTVLEGVQPKPSPFLLTPVTAPVGELAVPAGETETAARLDPANYTPVLDAPFYPFENPWGNGGSWNIPGDEYGNVLQVDYKFGDEDRTGLVYLPEVVRNSYYTVCCLMNNTGKFTVEYMVADWNDGDSWNDLVFDSPSYTNPLQPSPDGGSTVPATAPAIYYNPDYDPAADDTFDPLSAAAAGSYSFFFQLSAPSGQEWTATLTPVEATTAGVSAADYSVTVYDLAGKKVEKPTASDDFYRIVVRALNEDSKFVGNYVGLGITYTPAWEGAGVGTYLLINGEKGNTKWHSESGYEQVPELIEIEHIEN
jgi:hypothetical protein